MNTGWGKEDLPALKPLPLDKVNNAVKMINSSPPSPQDIAMGKMDTLLDSVTDRPIAELKNLREQIDNLIKAMEDRKRKFKRAFSEHLAFAATTIQAKDIIAEHVGKIVNEVSNGMAPNGVNE